MRSIRSIIFIRLFAIIFVFFFVVSCFAYFLTEDIIRQFVVSDSLTSLSSIANNVKTSYKSNLEDLDEIRDMAGFLPYKEAQAQKIVKRFLQFPNIFSTIHMYNKEGQLLFNMKRPSVRPYEVKQNFNEREKAFSSLANKVLKEKKPSASEVFYSPRGTLYQIYITPVFSDLDKTEIFGVLSGGVYLRLRRIDHLLHGLQLGKENFILITDSRNKLITVSGLNENNVPKIVFNHTKSASSLFFEPDKKAKNSSYINENLTANKSSFIVVSIPIDELKLVATLGINTNKINSEVRELSNRLLVAMVVGLLLSLIASIVLGNRLATPFRKILDAIEKINAGDFTARVDYEGEDEIGYLSKAVNDLAQKIQKNNYLGNLWSTEDDDSPGDDR